MENINIQIPDMQHSHCQVRVANAVNTLPGVHIKNTRPGRIEISIENMEQLQNVYSAIEQAGYRVE